MPIPSLAAVEPAPYKRRNVWLGFSASVSAITLATLSFITAVRFAFVEFSLPQVDPTRLPPLVAALGLAGALGAAAAATAFRPTRARSLLAAGFASFAAAALATRNATSEPLMLAAAGGIGFTLGWTLLVLSLCLRPTLHLRWLGLACGLGTGLAYAISDQPPAFSGAPREQLLLAAASSIAALATLFWIRADSSKPSSGADYNPPAAAAWIFLAASLAFLDALAFHLIQHHPAMLERNWDSFLLLEGNAFVHLCAAIVTGIALDRRWAGVSSFIALLALLASCWLLGEHMSNFPQGRVLHVAAVAIYFTTLLYIAARSGRRWFAVTLWSGAWLGTAAALVYALNQPIRRASLLVLGTTATIALLSLIIRGLWLRRVEPADSLTG